MKRVKWAILGPGRIAVQFARGLQLLPEAQRYAVGSRDAGRAEAFAREYGFEKAYGSYEELVADEAVEAVYVATPHPMHVEAVLLCLEHGKHVICEKPFAVNAAEAARMIEAARSRKLFLMEAMWTRFLPGVRKAVALIREGAIGQPRHVAVDFGFRAEVDPQSRLFAPALAGGSLLDVGVYCLSFLSLVFGQQPERIQSHLSIGATGVDEAATALLNYGGGRSAFMLSAVRVNTAQEAIIYGDAGSIRLPEFWHAQHLLLKNADGEQPFHLPFEGFGFQFQIQEVMDCLSRGETESAIMPLSETLAILQTMDSIRFQNKLRYPFEEQEA